MENYKCSAHNCWCGNREMEITATIRNNTDDLMMKVDGGGIYISTGGYTEHWAEESDFVQQYPETAEEKVGTMTNQTQIDSWESRLPEDLRFGTFEEDFMIEGKHYEFGAWSTAGNWVLAWDDETGFQGQLDWLAAEGDQVEGDD